MGNETFVTLNTGQKMPKIGFGTAKCADAMRAALRTALETGYRSIDTAFLYEVEEDIGAEIKDWIDKGKIRREELFITSKLPLFGNRSADVEHFLNKSLAYLQTDYVDLYLFHHPFALKHMDDQNNKNWAQIGAGNFEIDHDVDLESVWKAMEKMVKCGKAKAIGVSNFNSRQMERLIKTCSIPPAVNQIECHVYLQQNALRRKCQELGIAVVAYSPIGAPYTYEGSKFRLLEHERVVEIANHHEKTPAQILLRFLLEQDIVVIPKSVIADEIKGNFEVFDFKLSKDETKTLENLDRQKLGRVYHFRSAFPGCTEHKEYPFHEDF